MLCVFKIICTMRHILSFYIDYGKHVILMFIVPLKETLAVGIRGEVTPSVQ